MSHGQRVNWIVRFIKSAAYIFTVLTLSLSWSFFVTHFFTSSNIEASVSTDGDGFQVDINKNAESERLENSLPHMFDQSHSGNNAKSGCDLFYILVSTIDGRFTALDLHKDGTKAWSVEADSRPLYSSSLANMEMIRNGKKMRIIPSLDGALYQFDGEKVEAIPMSAETLLSSTYKLSDDSMIVGSKDLRSFGINLRTGEVQFTCGSEGCNSNQDQMNEGSHIDDKVIILTRTNQVVRSVDIKNGIEKWNFSVGQHEMRLYPGPDSVHNLEADTDREPEEEEEGIGDKMPFFKTSYQECENKANSDEEDFENQLRLVVPEGKVVALSKNAEDTIKWEHKLDSPIAKAWLVRNGNIKSMSLFDGRHIPTLGTFQPEDLENESFHQPLLYIGSHEKLLYIQPSPKMETVLKSFSNSQRIGHIIDPKIKVTWRPYLNTASHRTPILGGNRPGLPPQSTGQASGGNSRADTSLSVWHEDYPFDIGYFLYPEFQDKRSIKKVNLMLTSQWKEEEGIMESIPASLSMYWKEVTAITVVVSVLVHLVLSKLRPDAPIITSTSGQQNSGSSKNSDSNSQSMLVSNDSLPLIQETTSPTGGYVSRFGADFECLHCLGKGGFGVVFEAVNRVDSMHYAVKRTMLPKSEGAKEKVLREVRALAKLEHIGIVRYFNAWVESPPKGWQEETDKQYQFSSDFSNPASYSVTRSISPSPPPANLRERHQHRKVPIRPDVLEEASLGNDSEASDVFHDKLPQPESGSGEFSVHSNISAFGCEKNSDSASFIHTALQSDFSTSQNGYSGLDNSSSVPFSNYTNSSFSRGVHGSFAGDQTDDSIVFEDSTNRQGCGDNGTNTSQDDSIVFLPSDADSGTGTENNDASSKNKRHHSINITLSSQSGDCSQNDGKDLSKMSEEGTKFFLYIQMQLYRKETLKDWLSNNTLNRSRETVLDIFDQIVCAVDYVHHCGLMHRDLKPSNIFFSADGVVKVGDFGLVTALSVHQDQEDQGSKASRSNKHTAEVGTSSYMSPEQIARKPYDLTVDIFSLGLIFLELWIPFTTVMERIKTLLDARKQRFPANFSRELPLECELVKKMTSIDPKLRPSARDILDHALLKDLAPTRMSSIRRTRSRTISNNSNS